MQHKASTELSAYHRVVAEQYYLFLRTLDGKDGMYMNGIREGKNKFLSNMYGTGLAGGKKYRNSHYVSKAAKPLIENLPKGALVFEHIVPKQKYIQSILENDKSVTVDKIHSLLNKLYITATITKEEERKLRKGLKEEDFEIDVFARYEGRVELEKNPYFAVDKKQIRR